MSVIFGFALASILDANKIQDICKLVWLKAKLWWIAIEKMHMQSKWETLENKTHLVMLSPVRYLLQQTFWHLQSECHNKILNNPKTYLPKDGWSLKFLKWKELHFRNIFFTVLPKKHRHDATSNGENQEYSENSHRPPNERICLMRKIWIVHH